MNQHMPNMLSKTEIIAAIRRLVEDENVTQREIASVMGVSSPRISELLRSPKKRLTVDEAKKFVDHYRIGEEVIFSLDALTAILRGLIVGRVAPHVSDEELEELAGALQHLLRRLSSHPTFAENLEGLTEAAQAAVYRPDPRRR